MMNITSDQWIADLATQIDAAMVGGDDADRCLRIKDAVMAQVGAGDCPLDPALLKPTPDGYGRRLLHKDPGGAYSVVLMIWGSDQGTPLHDHSGMWCVECVCVGSVTVESYERLPNRCSGTGLWDFKKVESVKATVGEAGALIPPFDYHTVHNHGTTPSATIHIYCGELTECSIFVPTGSGYQHEVRPLTYSD